MTSVSDSSLWAITTYYNPLEYRSRRENFRVFRDLLPVPLLAVEYSTGSPQLEPCDADILVQLRGRDVMWQKERLYNIAREHLPPECRYVLWLDCDIAFSGEDWPQRVRDALESYAFIQPFDRLALLQEGARPPVQHEAQVLDWRTSLVALIAGGVDPRAIYGKWGVSLTMKYAHGIAWAARREICDQFTFYDRLIVGGGDKAFTAALFGQHETLAPTFAFDEPYRSDYLSWAATAHAVAGGSLGFIEATACHLWHGAIALRGYDDRQEKLRDAGFKAMNDLGLDPESGCWRWITDKPALHEHVRNHFIRRQEDG